MTQERLIKLPEVIHITGKSRSSVYDDIKKGTFPANVPIGIKARAWRMSDINQWIEDRCQEATL